MPIFELDGLVVPGDGTQLHRATHGFAHSSPVFCRNRHRQGPNRTLVGWQSCIAVDGGHRTYLCRTCGDTIYVPTVGPQCSHRDFDGRTPSTRTAVSAEDDAPSRSATDDADIAEAPRTADPEDNPDQDRVP
ncbi:hypothetical protein [Nocardia sp. NPDC052566]|uniref:hypothetical protein n=1 Tax=Nocardia sp. NPDC052566 TaxID=3364330 RepID=UPI0037C99C12